MSKFIEVEIPDGYDPVWDKSTSMLLLEDSKVSKSYKLNRSESKTSCGKKHPKFSHVGSAHPKFYVRRGPYTHHLYLCLLRFRDKDKRTVSVYNVVEESKFEDFGLRGEDYKDLGKGDFLEVLPTFKGWF